MELDGCNLKDVLVRRVAVVLHLGAESWPSFPLVAVVVLGGQRNRNRWWRSYEAPFPCRVSISPLESKVLKGSPDSRAAGVVLRGELTLRRELIAGFVRLVMTASRPG
jgi:hypothetical protein